MTHNTLEVRHRGIVDYATGWWSDHCADTADLRFYTKALARTGTLRSWQTRPKNTL